MLDSAMFSAVSQSSPSAASGDERTLGDVLSEAWWTPWVLLGICVLAALWMLPSLVKHRGRAAAVEAAAQQSGMRFQEQDGPGLGRFRFRLMVPTKSLNWTAANVVTADAGGASVHAFDARTWSEIEVQEDQRGGTAFGLSMSGGDDSRPKRIRRTRGRTVSGAVVRLPINAPRVLIVHENHLTKLIAGVGRVDLDVESELFNRTYHVLSEDRRFAQQLLDARVLDLIVQSEGKMEFEFLGNHLLVRAPLLEPELLPGLVRYAARFPDVISDLVRDRWRDASAFDA